MGGRQEQPSSSPQQATFNRIVGITLLTGVVLILVIGVVFSVAYGSRNITSNATALHKADESLRAATVARAQTALAVYMASVDQEFGSVSIEPRQLSMREAQVALVDLETGIAELTGDDVVDTARLTELAGVFLDADRRVLDLLAEPDLQPEAISAADEQIDDAFRDLAAELVTIRNGLADSVEESDILLGRIGDVARFLVAFFVPGAVILVYRELTRRRQKEAELEVKLEAERTLARSREEFIANASHELRTPLTGIIGLSMLVEEDPRVAESDTLRNLMATIVDEANDLSRMVDDLLTTARLDAGALHYSFDDVEVCAEVHDTATSLIRNGLNVDIECVPGVVRADRTRLRQVVRNLLSNASKYGGPRVRVEGRLAESTYILTVADNGGGLPKEVEERLFERFVHADQPAGTIDSVGLGLSIVRALVTGMGGAVVYERVGDETTFHIRLPLVATADTSHLVGSSAGAISDATR